MGFIMTRARMFRSFAISSRSPVRRAKTLPNLTSLDGAGGSSGEDTGDAVAAWCFGCSVAAGASAFLPQPISNRRASNADKSTRERYKVELVDICLLLYPAYQRDGAILALPQY